MIWINKAVRGRSARRETPALNYFVSIYAISPRARLLVSREFLQINFITHYVKMSSVERVARKITVEKEKPCAEVQHVIYVSHQLCSN